jgi:uncharacterized protein (TIGR00369 family)
VTAFTPADPDYEAIIRENFARQGLMATLGAKMEHVEPGRVVIAAGFADGLSQQQGFFHGGVIGALGDSAGGYATLTLLPRGSDVVTVEYKVNFIRPARGVRVVAEGQVLRAGRSIAVGPLRRYEHSTILVV